jgi:hypothetical protein
MHKDLTYKYFSKAARKNLPFELSLLASVRSFFLSSPSRSLPLSSPPPTSSSTSSTSAYCASASSSFALLLPLSAQTLSLLNVINRFVILT